MTNKELLTKIEKLEAQNKIMRECLEYIADQENIGNDSLFFIKAKEALTKIKGDKYD